MLILIFLDLLNQEKLVLSDKWGTKRPEQLSPTEFIEMTAELFGEQIQPALRATLSTSTATAPATATNSITSDIIADSDTVRETKRSKKIKKSVIDKDAATTAIKNDNGDTSNKENSSSSYNISIEDSNRMKDRMTYVSRPIWRKALFGASGSSTYGAAPTSESLAAFDISKNQVEK
jgi:hypothetical protein